ncbi:MAG TPA: low affinity iron permease family protein [Polyangiaceae bacterium]|nr:low affinity iron permease family protein [Polyangiaceae bacterium]
MKDESAVEEVFAKLAGKISQATGSFWTFSLALLVVLVWAATGPIFHYSETWQLVINTGTTIVTFLMVFVIQHAQNKDMRAVQLKLNEIIAAVEGASNRLIDVEDLTDHELEHLYSRFQRLARDAQKLSQGAKLSIDSSDPDNLELKPQGEPRDDLPHGHAHGEKDKRRVQSKEESRRHAKRKNPTKT